MAEVDRSRASPGFCAHEGTLPSPSVFLLDVGSHKPIVWGFTCAHLKTCHSKRCFRGLHASVWFVEYCSQSSHFASSRAFRPTDSWKLINVQRKFGSSVTSPLPCKLSELHIYWPQATLLRRRDGKWTWLVSFFSMVFRMSSALKLSPEKFHRRFLEWGLRRISVNFRGPKRIVFSLSRFTTSQ